MKPMAADLTSTFWSYAVSAFPQEREVLPVARLGDLVLGARGAARRGRRGLVRVQQALLGHLLERVVDRAGLGVGPLVRAPVLQVVAHLVAVGPPVLADGAQHQETDR
ncbi:hypothetical protein GCM10020295_35330 [Streptomyces cinereospinus]